MLDGKGWILILYVGSLVGVRKGINSESRGKDYSERDGYRGQQINWAMKIVVPVAGARA